MMKYKVGDKVRVRQWDAMKREYGVNENGDIRAPSGFLIFTSGMKHLCGESVIVKKVDVEDKTYHFTASDGCLWGLSEDMIEGYAFEYGEEIEIKYYDDWNKRIFVGYVDGVDKPYICVDKLSEDDFKKGNVFDTSFWKHARPIQKEEPKEDCDSDWQVNLEIKKLYKAPTENSKESIRRGEEEAKLNQFAKMFALKIKHCLREE